MLDVPFWVYAATIGAFALVLVADLIIVDRRAHDFGPKEATRWVLFYIGCAIAFGIGLGIVSGASVAGQFFAGYVLEYSLSVDNLFVFLVIMTSFAVPKAQQHKVLLVGVVLALVLRGIFIALGAAAVSRFAATFYVFGAFLIYTAIKLARSGGDEEPEPGRNKVLKLVERVIPTSKDYDGGKVLTRIGGKRMATPLLVVMIAIGSTDVLFALDSIPAIFGVTSEPYLVFTANAFALMGLRQLYFLLGGLLSRLVYLSYGLALILGFIGVKLVLEAAHETVSTSVPEVPIWLSLVVIVVVLAVTTILSLRVPQKAGHPGTGAPTQPAQGDLSPVTPPVTDPEQQHPER